MSSSDKPPQYSELDPNGLNLAFFTKICANYFIHLFASKKHPFPASCSAWQAEFPAFVASVLQRSELDISVAIAAMILLHRYKAVHRTAVAYNGEAPRLFIEAYMNAAKVMGCPRLMTFWQHVSGDRYSREELLMMKSQFRKDLRGYVDIEPCTFDWFKMHLEAYSKTDGAREFASMAVEDPVLRCGPPPPPGYNPASVGQPPSYMKQNKLGVNTFRTMLDGEVLELHERLPRCR